MKKIILLILALILAACSGVTVSEFDKNLAKWEAANITHYRYTISVSCFCAFSDQMPLTIEVQDGEIVSMTSANGTLIDSTNQLYEVLAHYSTIDSVFLVLKPALDGDADEVSVSYDETYGFPTTMAIDQIEEAVDDELFISIEGFEVLE